MTLTISVNELIEKSKNPLLGIRPGWKRVDLGQIASVLNGFAFKSAQFSKEGGVPLIRIRDVGSDSTDTRYVGEYDERYMVDPGDLLVGMDGDFNCGRWKGPRALLNQRVCKISLLNCEYDPRFLDHTLPVYLQAINDATSSVTVKHLSSRSIEEIPLPFPPLAEQREIVAEIENQYSRLDEAVTNLRRVKANLKRYKAAVLKAAVEGRLVLTEAELARREGRTYETGAQLLQHILEIRRSQWKGRGKYKQAAELDTINLPELPEGWISVAIAQLLPHAREAMKTGPFGSLLKKYEHQSEGVAVLGIENIQAMQFAHGSKIHITKQKAHELEDYRVVPGDILISRSGTVGEVCVVPNDIGDARISTNLMKVSLAKGGMLPEFFMLLFNGSPFVLNQVSDLCKGSTRDFLNQEILKQLCFILPRSPNNTASSLKLIAVFRSFARSRRR